MNKICFVYPITLIFLMMIGCSDFDSFIVTEKPYVNQTFLQLYVGENAGNRNTVQLVSSPPGISYLWTSQDTSIVTVEQNGLVKALKEGITTITVASKDDKTVIDVNVKEYVPLDSFELSTHSIIGFWPNTTQVFITYFPDNATDVDIKWSSSNRKVADVYSNGFIKMLEEGRATVTAQYQDFVQTIDVWVPSPPEKMNKAGWSIPGYNPNSDEGTIGYSSQQRNDGGGILAIIDEDLDSYWHARYSSPASKYPHWFIIDLGQEVTVAQVGMARRAGDNRGQKGYQIYTCTEAGAIDLADPTVWYWEDQGEFSFDPNKNDIQTQHLSKSPLTRYIKVYIAEKYRGGNDYAMVGDFSVYIFND